ncbi:hypothetical protein OEZ85_013146 [Tetradesmus obliquus]|uniref:Kinesin motor domain-containing protein n=1 Tax=Tetradesmus obliquus TaxID=3088 RepID=A0ABY8U4U1_TETOB|nr:hypothetical protein OEZ85_013146 [Tetradesmus obliquus]
MGQDSRLADDEELEQEDDTQCEIMDGRLSAIMPRKLFQDDAAVKNGVLQVFVRMKPVPDTTDTCMVLDPNHLLKATWRNKEAVYKFSQIFQQEADQEAVYNGTTAALVEDCMDFRQPSAVVMAYGVTSAGKTFTMQGTADKPGIVPLALRDIFQSISREGHSAHRVGLSVCEIYNESIHDLLAPPSQRGKPSALRLKEDKAGLIQVQGMSEAPVHSAREALELLRRAAKARQSGSTGVNEHSSRSHAVITVKLQSAAGSAVAGGACSVMPAARQSFLHFVDLAGCERVKRTGNSGARLRESVAINSSLMTLARCLEVLRYNQQHPGDEKVIPYRESKITHLFKQVLHGNGRFVMVVNVSPASEAFNETKRVLQYAALASKVTMTSEIEATVAGEHWPHAGHALLPADGAPTAAAATAASSAAAASAAAALASAQARIEELLDDKADLEYEIDVVERKVELLREELIRCEVDKEQLESEIRAEVQAEMAELIQAATAAEKARADKAREEAAAARAEAAAAQAEAAAAREEAAAKVAEAAAAAAGVEAAHQEAASWEQKTQGLQQQLDELQQQQKAEHKQLKELKGAAEQAQRSMMPLAEHRQLLQQAQEAAAAAAREQEAGHIAEVRRTVFTT